MNFQLPPEVLMLIRSFLNDLRALYFARHILQVPDVFWRDCSRQFQSDPLNGVKGTRKPFAHHFAKRLLPKLCLGCGITDHCRPHVFFDGRICHQCASKPKFRVISMTEACNRFFLPRDVLRGGKRVSCTHYDCTMYLWQTVEEIAKEYHGSLRQVTRLRKEKQLRKKRLEERREQLKVEREEREERQLERKRKREDALNDRRLRVGDLDAEYSAKGIPFLDALHRTDTFNIVLGDFLSAKRLRPSTTVSSIKGTFQQVQDLYNTYKVEPHKLKYVGEHLQTGKSVQELYENDCRSEVFSTLQRVVNRIHNANARTRGVDPRECLGSGCTNLAAQTCPFQKCGKHCSGCSRHPRRTQ